MNVLLTTLNAKYIHINLAIRLLYELNRDWPGLAWREFTIKENAGDIADACAGYEVVAFSCYIWNISQTLAVAREIKARRPDTKILLGGPEVSYDWEDVIAREEVDFIITGEGETPFREFLFAYPNVAHLTNLVQKQAENVLYFSKTATFDLENFRHIRPYQHDAPEDLRNKVAYVETSRGCPYKCEFCLASLDNKVRYLPDEHIKANLRYLMEHGRVIKFLDRTFNMKREFTLDIFRFILANHRPSNVFQFEITADILHPDIVQFIQEHVPPGLFRFEIGIQTVNQRANLEVSRKQNFEKTKAIIKALDHKIEMHLDLIVGLALDYWADIKHSFEEVFKLFAPELQLGFLKFLKGTPVRHKHEQHGFVFDPEPPYQIIESNYLSRSELRQLEILEHALEIFWNKKRAPRALRHVATQHSIFDFLLGLGHLFGARHDFHKYTLPDVFSAINDYVSTHYADDLALRELLDLDHCLFQKTRPKPLFLQDLSRGEKFQLLQTLGLNPHQHRYLALPLRFDFDLFERENTIAGAPTMVLIQYTGTEKPIVVAVLPAAQMAASDFFPAQHSLPVEEIQF